MEPTVSSETSAIRTNTPRNYPKEQITFMSILRILTTRINDFTLHMETAGVLEIMINY